MKYNVSSCFLSLSSTNNNNYLKLILIFFLSASLLLSSFWAQPIDARSRLIRVAVRGLGEIFLAFGKGFAERIGENLADCLMQSYPPPKYPNKQLTYRTPNKERLKYEFIHFHNNYPVLIRQGFSS